jgi:hypothetical protein
LSSRSRWQLICLALLFVSAPAAVAHPAHTTVSEAEYNVESGRLEVALRLRPEDLEMALSQSVGRDLVLERETGEALDSLCAAYVDATFRIEPGSEAPLVWVGLEFEQRDVWLYFELPVPSPLGEAMLIVETLMELHAQQLNTVHVRGDAAHGTVTFSTDERRRPLRELIGTSSSVRPTKGADR